ncbi:Na+/H+ antiporter [Dyella sp. Tek66A03]|uniref:Na+/H+ antiporter n=1 Tax=Dyella sp. Tek66A03 TaxID=3458298 RepID=UPI00403EF233
MDKVALFHYLLALVFGAGVLTWLADRMALAPAVVLLLGGSAVALIGKYPGVDMDPGLVMVAMLPPLLMSSSFYTAWKDFRRELIPIMSLALGAVAFTTAAVAVAARLASPALPWPACFALGAIVSPPDAVAAKTMLQRFLLPTRLVTVLEGESLINDASGLVLYQMAIAAAMAGQFTLGGAAVTFAGLVLLGTAVGVACGQVLVWLIRRLSNPTYSIVLTFLMAWSSYGFAEHVGGSGVLSVVMCGLVLGVSQHQAFNAQTRIKAEATWETMVFVLDALVFILIGLALHGILGRMDGTTATLRNGVMVALAATGAVILARFLWVAVAIWLPSRLASRMNPSVRPWPLGEAIVLGWAGMRGVVSLAAALALPMAFAGRDIVVFSTFILIFATLVVQGLSLPLLLRVLKLRATHGGAILSEFEARARAFRAALAELKSIRERGREWDAGIIDSLVQEYEGRVQSNENSGTKGPEYVQRRSKYLRLELDLVGRSRGELLKLHHEGRIPNKALHRLEAELDLEELRLHRLLE